MKKLVICLVVICFISINVCYASVPVLIAGYWGPVTLNSDDYLFSLHLKVRVDNLTEKWATATTKAAAKWTNNSENYVIAEVVDSNYNVECASRVNWFWFMPDDAIATTNIRDSAGIWAWNFSSGSINTPNMNSNLEYAHIYVNEDETCELDSFSAKQKRAIMGHEIGHVLNLGHNNTVAPSIMDEQVAYTTDWRDIDTPQHRDRLNLINLYRTHLNRGG